MDLLEDMSLSEEQRRRTTTDISSTEVKQTATGKSAMALV
jgi:hypothetical protein